MKKSLIVAVAVLLLLPFHLRAQDVVKSNIAFGGVRVETTDIPGTMKTMVSFGVAVPISDGAKADLYAFTYVNAGKYGSISEDIALTWRLSATSKLGFGVLAGIGTDWRQAFADNLDPTAYLAGAGGGLFFLDLSNTTGVWGYGKYKFATDRESAYVDGGEIGLGIYKRF